MRDTHIREGNGHPPAWDMKTTQQVGRFHFCLSASLIDGYIIHWIG